MTSIDFLSNLKISSDFIGTKVSHDESAESGSAGEEAFHVNWSYTGASSKHVNRLLEVERRTEADHHGSRPAKRSRDACDASAARADRALEGGCERTGLSARAGRAREDDRRAEAVGWHPSDQSRRLGLITVGGAL